MALPPLSPRLDWRRFSRSLLVACCAVLGSLAVLGGSPLAALDDQTAPIDTNDLVRCVAFGVIQNGNNSTGRICSYDADNGRFYGDKYPAGTSLHQTGYSSYQATAFLDSSGAWVGGSCYGPGFHTYAAFGPIPDDPVFGLVPAGYFAFRQWCDYPWSLDNGMSETVVDPPADPLQYTGRRTARWNFLGIWQYDWGSEQWTSRARADSSFGSSLLPVRIDRWAGIFYGEPPRLDEIALPDLFPGFDPPDFISEICGGGALAYTLDGEPVENPTATFGPSDSAGVSLTWEAIAATFVDHSKWRVEARAPGGSWVPLDIGPVEALPGDVPGSRQTASGDLLGGSGSFAEIEIVCRDETGAVVYSTNETACDGLAVDWTPDKQTFETTDTVTVTVDPPGDGVTALALAVRTEGVYWQRSPGDPADVPQWVDYVADPGPDPVELVWTPAEPTAALYVAVLCWSETGRSQFNAKVYGLDRTTSPHDVADLGQDDDGNRSPVSRCFEFEGLSLTSPSTWVTGIGEMSVCLSNWLFVPTPSELESVTSALRAAQDREPFASVAWAADEVRTAAVDLGTVTGGDDCSQIIGGVPGGGSVDLCPSTFSLGVLRPVMGGVVYLLGGLAVFLVGRKAIAQ